MLKGNINRLNKGLLTKNALFIISLVFLGLVNFGCVGTMKSFSPQLEPIQLKVNDTKSIAVTSVIFKIQPGEKIGGYYNGLAKVLQSSHRWLNDISFGPQEFISEATTVLRENGYKVIGGEKELFKEKEEGDAQYQLGARIIALKYNSFGSTAGNCTDAVVDVDFVIMDSESEDILYEFSTDAHAKIKNKEGMAAYKAFGNAVKNLLGQKEFVELMTR